MPNIKVGFSASKKVGGSVQRHRALRIMREAVKPHIPQMARDHNYIFVAKDVVLQKSVSELQSICKQLLSKAGLLNE